jgi:thiol-disulfide isomerase/thioredoxin
MNLRQVRNKYASFSQNINCGIYCGSSGGLLFLALPAFSQKSGQKSGSKAVPTPAAQAEKDKEQEALQQALAEAGTSPVDFMRALETHLAKFPESPRRAELERAIAKAALEADDERRIVLYGERVLANEPDDFKLLERVARILLESEDKPTAERALKYAQRYEQLLKDMKKPSERIAEGLWREQLERGVGRAYSLQARAQGNLGRTDEALAFAHKSFETYPNAESAREVARWLSRSGKEAEAVTWFAYAFTIPDARQDDKTRAADRARLGELYRKLHDGSEKGLGDVVLEAYDKSFAIVTERQMRLSRLDPNSRVTDPMKFTLSGLQGDKLELASLKGKVVVMDFWATWCGPCRVQQPLYEQVRNRFKDRPEVVFLSINTDETRESVAPFIEENRWDKRVYFEDGLGQALQISSIPTAVLINKRGEIHSRMNGFIPERFVEMLSERIEQALAE